MNVLDVLCVFPPSVCPLAFIFTEHPGKVCLFPAKDPRLLESLKLKQVMLCPKPSNLQNPVAPVRSAKAEVSTLTIITTLVVLLVFVGLVWLVFLQREAIPSDSRQKREETPEKPGATDRRQSEGPYLPTIG